MINLRSKVGSDRKFAIIESWETTHKKQGKLEKFNQRQIPVYFLQIPVEKTRRKRRNNHPAKTNRCHFQQRKLQQENTHHFVHLGLDNCCQPTSHHSALVLQQYDPYWKQESVSTLWQLHLLSFGLNSRADLLPNRRRTCHSPANPEQVQRPNATRGGPSMPALQLCGTSCLPCQQNVEVDRKGA